MTRDIAQRMATYVQREPRSAFPLRATLTHGSAFYLGAALALALPFSSPLWEPLAIGARILSALAGAQ